MIRISTENTDSGIDDVSSSSPVNFAISSSPEEGEDDIDVDDDDDAQASRYWLNVPDTLLQIRRLSDQGLRHAKQHFRRLSNSSSKMLKKSYLNRLLSDAGSGRSSGSSESTSSALRKGSADPMSILKDQEGLNYCSKNHGIGFARKSVSFCQRDNVHVYENDAEDYYEDDDIVDRTDVLTVEGS